MAKGIFNLTEIPNKVGRPKGSKNKKKKKGNIPRMTAAQQAEFGSRANMLLNMASRAEGKPRIPKKRTKLRKSGGKSKGPNAGRGVSSSGITTRGRPISRIGPRGPEGRFNPSKKLMRAIALSMEDDNSGKNAGGNRMGIPRKNAENDVLIGDAGNSVVRGRGRPKLIGPRGPKGAFKRPKLGPIKKRGRPKKPKIGGGPKPKPKRKKRAKLPPMQGPKRKRGRPRKLRSIAEEDEEKAEQLDLSGITPPGGPIPRPKRKRRTKLPAMQGPKRARGRPRKAKLPPLQGPKRRRGRPTGSKTTKKRGRKSDSIRFQGRTFNLKGVRPASDKELERAFAQFGI